LKKLIPILFLSIYLVSATELHELLKLPQLIEHFIEHNTDNKQTTFFDFLFTHYSSSNDGDNDIEKDVKLPFKTNDKCIGSAPIAFVSNHFDYSIIKPVYSDKKSYSKYTELFIKSSFLSTIWQPPKSC
jgi:hypothetical protein